MRRLRILLRVLPLIILLAFNSFAQDPGVQDSLAFGNPDGSAMQVFINSELTIPVYFKCDENISFMHFCLATENLFIAERGYFIPHGALLDWDLYGTLPKDGWPIEGQTSQSIVGIADYLLPSPNYINTQGEWELIGNFTMTTSSNPDIMGQTSNLHPGKDPIEGVTVIFDENWTPIVPGMKFSALEFLPNVPPVLVTPFDDSVYVYNSGFNVSFFIEATDETGDTLSLEIEFPYDDYTLTALTDIPGHIVYRFDWVSPDSLVEDIACVCRVADQYDLTDESNITIQLKSCELYTSIGETYPGYWGSVDLGLNLSGLTTNAGSFNILLSWDYEILSLEDVVPSQAVEQWSYFNIVYDAEGSGTARFVGYANLTPEESNPPLTNGNNLIAQLKFSTIPNHDLQGWTIPVEFIGDDFADNAISDSTGYVVVHPETQTGGIRFLTDAEILIGDINLNGRPFEVGDAITLSNYLIDPIENPLSPIQIVASDCNRDGIPASVADLIYIIRILNGDEGPLLGMPSPGDVDLALIESENGISFKIDSGDFVAGMVCQLRLPAEYIESIVVESDLEAQYKAEGDIVNLLVFSPGLTHSLNGETITIIFNTDYYADIEIISQQFSDKYGRLIAK